HLEAARRTPRVTVGVRDRDKVDAVDLAQHARVVAAHVAQADEPCSQVRHHAPAFVTARTAVTMRSRSASLSAGCTGREKTSAAARSVTGSSRPSAKRARLARRWLGIG